MVGLISHPACLEHDTGAGHPERPDRLRAILAHLRSTDLWPRLRHIDAPAADRADLELIHPAGYIDAIERACRSGPLALDPDTPVSPGSWDAALRAAGAATRAIDLVADGELTAAFCAVRPPGHHAMPNRAMGFCLFNNVAIAARHAQRRRDIERVLIVDWDVHHGNGTQAAFYSDPMVLYFSTHQEPCYPGTGRADETGRGPGDGATINVPLAAGSGDAELLDAFERRLVPAADQFRPQLMLISAGFDAHRDDPLASLNVTESGYAALTRLIVDLARRHCDGRIVSVLEGGYELRALSASVEAHLRALMPPA